MFTDYFLYIFMYIFFVYLSAIQKLFEAVKLGQMSILEETLRVSGFIKDAVDDYGMSALHHAVLTQNIECISLLIDLQCPLDIQDKQGTMNTLMNGFLEKFFLLEIYKLCIYTKL